MIRVHPCYSKKLTRLKRIMFIREFRVIDNADPVDLRRRLKNDDLERYGDAFTPEFVYEAIKQLSRFESMRVSNSALFSQPHADEY